MKEEKTLVKLLCMLKNRYPLLIGAIILLHFLFWSIPWYFKLSDISIILLFSLPYFLIPFVMMFVLRHNRTSFILSLAATIFILIQIIILTRTEPWSGGLIVFLFCYIFFPIGFAFLWLGILYNQIKIKKHLRIGIVLIAIPIFSFLIYIIYEGAILNERSLDYQTYTGILAAFSLFASIIADLGGYSLKYVKSMFKSLSKAVKSNEKFIDFKFITIFRLLFCLLTMLTFLMPWTYSIGISSGLGGFSFFYTDTGITKSGYDYMVGCAPIKDIDLLIQMPYLIFTPILLLFSMALMFFNNKNRLLGSMALILFSAIPILIWYFEIDSLITLPYRSLFFLTYGLLAYIILVIANMIIGLVTLKFSDIE